MRKNYITAAEHSFCSFEYTLLEHLIFTERLSEIRFLLENSIPQKYLDKNPVPQDRKVSHQEVWKILQARAWQILGENQKTEEFLKAVSLGKIDFGWQKYYSIIYYLTLMNLKNKERNKFSKKIISMAQELNMTYFERIISEGRKK